MKDSYILGLDIGIASVGWSIINRDRKRIEDVGVRIFETAETPKTGDSLNKIRRDKRSSRRMLRRKKQRQENIKNIFIENGYLSQSDIDLLLKSNFNPYFLRTKALDEELNMSDLFLVFYHIAKKRGYKSNRKEQSLQDDLLNIDSLSPEEKKNIDSEMKLEDKKKENNGKVLKAIVDLDKKIKDSKSRTIGEYLYTIFNIINKDGKSLSHLHKIRNSSGSYEYSITRRHYQDEVNKIFESQITYGKIQNEFIKNIREKIFYQRPFAKGDSINKMVGYCQFEIDKDDKGNIIDNLSEKRAPKATLAFQEFILWNNLNNNIKIYDVDTGTRNLSLSEKQIIASKVFDLAKIDYKQIRKLLNLPENSKFDNLSYIKASIDSNSKKKDVEETIFFEAKGFYPFKKILNIKYGEMTDADKNDINELARIATIYKDTEPFSEALKLFNSKRDNHIKLTDEQIQKISSLSFDGYGHLSIKAINNLLPFMKEGYVYTDACDKLVQSGNEKYRLYGSPKNRNNKLLPIPANDRSITSPIVKRSISQTRKVVNAIIDKYGQPYEIHIELARDISKDRDERNKIEKSQKKNEEINIALKKEGLELGYEPNSRDILKFRLYKEQESKCIYSGKNINISRLNEDGYVQVDHIVPFSRSGDDSRSNKVLVLTSENQNKANRTPYEWFGSDETRWSEYVARVEYIIKDINKKKKLLIKNVEKDGMKSRMLNDTRHSTKFIKNYIEDTLNFESSTDDNKNKKKVIVVNGMTTSYMRKRFGLNKLRSEGDTHHAMDAIMVAIADDSYIQKIAHIEKAKQMKRNNGILIKNNAIDPDTDRPYSEEKELINLLEADDRYLRYLPDPFDRHDKADFKSEVEIRLKDILTDNDRETLRKVNSSYDKDFTESIKPIFVSRVPRRDSGGAIHAETIRSAKYIDTSKGDFRTTENIYLQDLTLDRLDDSPIKDTDKYLYKILKERLQLFNGDSKKAFVEPIRKGNKDTSPIIKSIKAFTKTALKSYIPFKSGGVVEYGDMVRIDIYTKVNTKNKVEYFAIPIYTWHVLNKIKPNKICTQDESEYEWKELTNEYKPLFSLFKNDLIKVIDKNKTIFGYYNSFDRSSAGIKIIKHDNPKINNKDISIRKSIQTLVSFEKYEVDILGNYKKVEKHALYKDNY